MQRRTVSLWALPLSHGITCVSLLPEPEFSLLPSIRQPTQPTGTVRRFCLEDLFLPLVSLHSRTVTASLVLLGAMKAYHRGWSIPICSRAEFFTLVRLPLAPKLFHQSQITVQITSWILSHPCIRTHPNCQPLAQGWASSAVRFPF